MLAKMESSEEEDDFHPHEAITPQSKINSMYQSNTEKGIRKLCSELMDLKDSVENLHGNMHSKYLAFFRISDEAIEMEHELRELQKHRAAQGIIVKDMMRVVSRELDIWKQDIITTHETRKADLSESDPLVSETENHRMEFLEMVDILLAEHKVEEAVLALTTEESNSLELRESGSPEVTSYKSSFQKRKVILVDQLIQISKQPSISMNNLRKVVSGLYKLGQGALAHQLLLETCSSRLQKNVKSFLPLCSIYSQTYSMTLSKFVFTMIFLTTKESNSIFADNPTYTSKLIHWAERELQTFVQIIKEKSAPSHTLSALRAMSICIQASFSHCSSLESQGLKLLDRFKDLLHPYMEEVLEMNFVRAKNEILDSTVNDEIELSHQLDSPLSDTISHVLFLENGSRFMVVVKEIVDQVTPSATSFFKESFLKRLPSLFDNYVAFLTQFLPATSEDDHLTEQQEVTRFRAETDTQQLAILGTAFTVADELLGLIRLRICCAQNESKEQVPMSLEIKDLKRNLQTSLDKIRDYFCLQCALSFIYSRDEHSRLDASIYINDNARDLFWDSHPLPSSPFQALFAKLQQLASDAGDVLLGKDKIQKNLLSRLTETVVMWLLNEQEFWDVLENESIPLQPFGLQQLILDMNFIMEVTVCGGYPSRHVNRFASSVIARAIRIFSSRGIDPQSALPENEWFVDAAKSAYNKLTLGTPPSDTDNEHTILQEDVSDIDEILSNPSSPQSIDSFASANMDQESPIYSTDSES